MHKSGQSICLLLGGGGGGGGGGRDASFCLGRPPFDRLGSVATHGPRAYHCALNGARDQFPIPLYIFSGIYFGQISI